ncbi:MAG: hypothetical protein IJC27_07775 [Lentisphaeria bacterium]|nr:hypothetical protein [Lentisphaeria bacterium]
MKNFTAAVIFSLFCAVVGNAGESKIPDIRADYDKPNYDPAKIAPYTLEDPLTFVNGKKVTTVDEWKIRRREILDIFAKEMFGQEPPAPEHLIIEKVEENSVTLAGFGLRSQYKMYFKADKSGPVINWLVIAPRHAKKPVPLIMYLNYHGNHTLLNDKEVIIPSRPAHYPAEYQFGSPRGKRLAPENRYHLPIQMILSAGYAVVSACYMDISPDPESYEKNPDFQQHNFAYTGVFELWGKRDESRTDNITALGAWAWALSRGVDLAEKLPFINAKQTIVAGCSRLGKAALLAAARDERFSVCVPIQCGGGGVTLAKRDFGENIATQMRMFSHWYCKAYKKYERNPAKLLTFDQHLLLAAIAPRRVLVGGYDNPWFDTEGEFLACKAASRVWEFLGKTGLPAVNYPDSYDNSAIGRYLGYFRRTEEHGMTGYDWWQLLKFADADVDSQSGK